MEYLIWVALVVLIGVVIIWKYKGGSPSVKEQAMQREVLDARSSTFLSRTSDKEDTLYNGIPNPPPMRRGDGTTVPLPKRPYYGDAPKPSRPIKTPAFGSSYSSDTRQSNSGIDLTDVVVAGLVLDALGVFEGEHEPAPARDIPPAPADPTPEPAYEPKASTQTDFSSTTDYSEPSRTNTDSGWSSNDRSDSGWSSSSSDSSSYDSGSSSSSSDSSNW